MNRPKNDVGGGLSRCSKLHRISSDDTRLEIGHLLFIEIVGYSKLLINQQTIIFMLSLFTESALA